MSLLTPGTHLEGKYEILDRLEGGGMGEVYRARHVHLQEVRVIKLLRADMAKDPSAAQRFHREARTATQIKHTHVATLHDYSRLPDGRYYMVWEYIAGEDVASFLSRRGAFPLRQALGLGMQTLRGLEAIHAADVIHRDLSPDNLVITRDRQDRPVIKIIDLGLAKSLTEPNAYESQVGGFGGKLRYCSPEQAGLIEGSLDHRSDLYSFAVVLYEMICGELPFAVDRNPGSLLRRFLQPALPLRGRNPKIEVPEELSRILERALAVEPGARFADAAGMMAALGAVVDRRRPVAKPAPPPATASHGRSTRELSEEARRRILADLGRASRRIDETARLIGEADRAVKDGRFDAARKAITRLEELDPQVMGLPELKKRLAEAESRRRRLQVMQTEEMLDQYLSGKQTTLAEMAFETLLELEPAHPQKASYEGRISELSELTNRRKDAETLVRVGRESLSSGDLATARRQLERLEESGEWRSVEELRKAMELTAQEEKQRARVESLKEQLEGQLDGMQLSDAESTLTALSELDVPKVMVDLYRARLAECRSQLARESKAEIIERRFPEELAAENWEQARELALDLEATLPGDERPGKMFAEIAEREEAARKRQAIAEGAKALETYLAEGKLTEAEVAWEVLEQLAPDHPQGRRYLKQLRTLRKKQKE